MIKFKLVNFNNQIWKYHRHKFFVKVSDYCWRASKTIHAKRKEDPPAELEDDTEDLLHTGVANGWRRNQAYKNLMVDVEFDKLQNHEILEYFSGMVHNKKNTSQESLGSDLKY